MLRNRVWTTAVFVLIILLSACQSPEPLPPTPTPKPPPLEVFEFTESSELKLLYPSTWVADIPQQGILLFGEEHTVFGAEPGAMTAVLLIPPQRVHGDLQGEFEHYLDFGPRRDGYVEVGEVELREVDGFPARTIRMSQPGDDEKDPFEAEITAIEMANGSVYFFTSTAPAEIWETNQERFFVILNSVDFRDE